MTYLVEFIYWAEATPRQTHTHTVDAADADEAGLLVHAHFADDRIGIIGVQPEETK